MLVDAREIPDSSSLNSPTLDTTICIAGAGIAGITLALELSRSGIDVILIEGGGLQPDEASDDLYRGDNTGLPYAYDCDSRSRYLGGSSNCWGGWNRPLEMEDFAQRNWLPHSGWPIGKHDLQPYYTRTHELLELGPPTFDADFWGEVIRNNKARRAQFDSPSITDSFSQFSPPTRMGITYRSQLENNPNLRVLLHANVVNIATDSNAQAVQALDVATLDGKRFRVFAKYFVLAMGAIENARLLLASTQVRAGGLGNDRDLVGRYFMDHPRLQCGEIRFRDQWKNNLLYDIKYHKTRLLSAHGTAVAAQLVLRPEIIEREQILQSRTWFRSVFVRENSPSIEALYRFAHAPAADRITQRIAQKTLARIFASPPFLRGVRFEIIAEPDPDPNSRVTLSRDKDALGMPRASVHWQVGPLVQKTISRTLQIISAELTRSGQADIVLPDLFPNGVWPTSLLGTWHHMGTTRMSDSPEHGVVNRDCRVHGVGNLFIAGSSVFPTGGGNFPTMTLTALALRLANHLQQIQIHEKPLIESSATASRPPMIHNTKR